MNVHKLSEEEIINLYLEYCNDFITPEGFGEHYNLNYDDTIYIIETGNKNINNVNY